MSFTTSAHRREVPLPQAYRLLNHGPTVLVSAAQGGRRNVMAAAWAMPLDFDPPKVTVVIDRNTFTRTLIEASGHFALSVPCRALADATFAAGTLSGAARADKLADCGLASFPAQRIDTPLVEGCVAWLECRVIVEPHHQQAYDLFVAEVLAAQADERVFANGRWRPDSPAELRTLHHQSGGAFFVAGETVQARSPGG
ncbi:flavin reductase family protein [uncultured Piscinibacter sp.]|uniref:flavin reductase family protein n=1 Tax=uncultured Piscinibacter sp. TaxID=1131835 RepID=UPI0026142571|nr:flavin reductase family protein [uncultured Piscinibacter sp.]